MRSRLPALQDRMAPLRPDTPFHYTSVTKLYTATAVMQQKMQARWNRFGLPRDRTAIMAPGWPVEYGLGIKRFRLPRMLNAGRHSPTLIGHTGASGSWLFWCPERDLYLAGTVDQTIAAPAPYRLLPKLVHRLDGRLAPAVDDSL